MVMMEEEEEEEAEEKEEEMVLKEEENQVEVCAGQAVADLTAGRVWAYADKALRGRVQQ